MPARGANERFAVFGDFGLANDECMTDLISEAAKGTFDSVLHVGDWACVGERGSATRATRSVFARSWCNQTRLRVLKHAHPLPPIHSYNFETAASIVGNSFMTLMQGYAATKPVMPSEGNHVSARTLSRRSCCFLRNHGPVRWHAACAVACS